MVRKKFFCRTCGKRFKLNVELLKHMEQVHSKKNNYLKKREDPIRVQLRSAPFSCRVCQKTFKTASKLKRHCYSHMDVKPYPCDHCGKRFGRTDHLKNHLRTVHAGNGGKTHTCKVCDQQFQTAVSMNRHMRTLHGEKRKNEVCPVCCQTFTYKIQLKKHYAIAHSGTESFMCYTCGHISSSRDAIERHASTKHVLKPPWTCVMCLANFVKICDMKEHECNPGVSMSAEVVVRVTLDDTLVVDEENDTLDQMAAIELLRKFENRGRKRKNLMTKSSVENTETDDKKAKNERNVQNHVVKVDSFLENGEVRNNTMNCGANDRTFNPPDEAPKVNMNLSKNCNAGNSPNQKIDENIKTVQNFRIDKNFKKDKKKTRKPVHVQKDSMNHTNAVKLKTDGLNTNTLEKNVENLMIGDFQPQNGLSDYKCKFCRKRFTSLETKMAHEVKHESTTKKLTCTLCEKSFADISKLARHLRVHTGSRPYVCEVCLKDFMRNDHLQHHLKVHTRNQTKGKSSDCDFKCNFCSAMFANVEALHLHQLKKHSPPEDEGLISTSDEILHFPSNDDFETLGITQHGSKENEHVVYHKDMCACEPCKMTFSNESELEEHILSVHNDSECMFQCGMCDRQFEIAQILLQHVMEQHRFDVCGYEADQALHPFRCNPFRCNPCQEAFADSHSFSEHLLERHLEKSTPCLSPPGKKNVPTKRKFLARKYAHLDSDCDRVKLSEKCVLCDKNFSCGKDLQKHVLTDHDNGMVLEVGLT